MQKRKRKKTYQRIIKRGTWLLYTTILKNIWKEYYFMYYECKIFLPSKNKKIIIIIIKFSNLKRRNIDKCSAVL